MLEHYKDHDEFDARCRRRRAAFVSRLLGFGLGLLAKCGLLEHSPDHPLLEDVRFHLPCGLLGRVALPFDEKLLPSALHLAFLTFIDHLTMASRACTRSRVPSTLVR